MFPSLSQVVLDGFRSCQVVSRFSKYTDVLIKNSVQGRTLEILWIEENWKNNVTFAMLKTWIRKEQIIQYIYL